MTDNTAKCRDLHALYVSLTGREMPMTMQCIMQWEMWTAHGHIGDDLRTVVSHIKYLIRERRRFPESLRFSNLIGNTERFLEDLVEAKAINRRPAKMPASKASVLRATGRPVDPPQQREARPVSSVLASPAFQKFLQLRKDL